MGVSKGQKKFHSNVTQIALENDRDSLFQRRRVAGLSGRFHDNLFTLKRKTFCAVWLSVYTTARKRKRLKTGFRAHVFETDAVMVSV